jgi:DNA polymerase III subunit delta
MPKEVDQILLDIKRRLFKPIYFLCGEEPYYIDLISDQLEKSVLDESEREFNQTVVYGKDTDLATILSLAKQFPMMSEYQVVIVKEAQNIKELNKSADVDDDDDRKPANTSNAGAQFQHYVQNPQSSTILVFCYKYKKLDKRSALTKAIQKNAVYMEFSRMYDNQVPDWISSYVKEKKYVIGPKATFLMSEFLGNDLSKIVNEIAKLTINLSQGSEITAEMVQDNIGISKDYNVFELQDALAKKDILKANRIINYFASNEKDHPPVMVLGLLYNYFSKLLRYQFLGDKSKSSAAQALGINPFFVEGYARAATNYNTAKLKNIFSYLKEYDLKTKGVDNSSVSGGELMKELVFKILH